MVKNYCVIGQKVDVVNVDWPTFWNKKSASLRPSGVQCTVPLNPGRIERWNMPPRFTHFYPSSWQSQMLSVVTCAAVGETYEDFLRLSFSGSMKSPVQNFVLVLATWFLRSVSPLMCSKHWSCQFFQHIWYIWRSVRMISLDCHLCRTVALQVYFMVEKCLITFVCVLPQCCRLCTTFVQIVVSVASFSSYYDWLWLCDICVTHIQSCKQGSGLGDTWLGSLLGLRM